MAVRGTRRCDTDYRTAGRIRRGRGRKTEIVPAAQLNGSESGLAVSDHTFVPSAEKTESRTIASGGAGDTAAEPSRSVTGAKQHLRDGVESSSTLERGRVDGPALVGGESSDDLGGLATEAAVAETLDDMYRRLLLRNERSPRLPRLRDMTPPCQ